MRVLVIAMFLYACGTWTRTAELQKRIQSLEFRCFRNILDISYKDRFTNEHVRKTIIKHIGPYEDLLATVKPRKLKWYGHVTRSDGLTNMILHGTVEGIRRRGGPRNSWIDNIADWTGKSFAETQAMAHNRQEWRELTRKSTMTRLWLLADQMGHCKAMQYIDTRYNGPTALRVSSERDWYFCQSFKEKCRRQYSNSGPPVRHSCDLPLSHRAPW